MEKREQLYEGKAKKVFATDDPALVIVDYKDDATAGDGAKRGTIRGKGVVNNRLSNHMMKLLEEKGVPTHFVQELSERETLVKKVKIVPLEVIVRNVAAAAFPSAWVCRRARCCNAPPSNSAIKTTPCTTRLSTGITPWRWASPLLTR